MPRSVYGTCNTLDPLPGVPNTRPLTNPYHYTTNNPTNLSDPLGLRPNDDTYNTSTNVPTPWGHRFAGLVNLGWAGQKTRYSVAGFVSVRLTGPWGVAWGLYNGIGAGKQGLQWSPVS